MVSSWDEGVVKNEVETLPQIFWAAHEDFDFVGPTSSFDECIDAVVASSKHPFFINDSRDNPTAGRSGRVHAIKHGDRDAGIEVVLQVGSILAILTQMRKPYHHELDFTDLNLKPREADIVIVKIVYLEPELQDMAADLGLALTPGGVDQDLKRLGHHRIRRPMSPFDEFHGTRI
ncbi:hypothetical protein A1O7_05299 [Cladophialophora yegresii CBS 114405]|uniref:Microcystin LR degradation protein MlrC C-terminal domain-containing protein n=1 Tax=Cladophialophora yegresii CBS 114405 TaxID=1182544 RepID=W9W9E3_9EURO|nr:uncharacterized protein A1O7_05299 [Cladophialophora yegresii CBS 114405]EXJ61146.1 hypothetical protein A1O7_05299 [Cladophialophora yegresii CBS 114405]